MVTDKPKIPVSGVYAIVNIINDKLYIGSAVNICKRWQSHTHYLNSNRHANKYLQRSWNSYSKRNFIFTVVEYRGVLKNGSKTSKACAVYPDVP